MKTQKVYDYDEWLKIADYNGLDPEDDEFSIDLGGGNTRDWEFIGVRPEEEPDE